jgi:hypothetical protein
MFLLRVISAFRTFNMLEEMRRLKKNSLPDPEGAKQSILPVEKNIISSAN